MVLSESSTIVGVFTDAVYADLAADELHRAGFSDDEISVVKHRDESGGFIDSLKSLFKGQEGVPIKTVDDFIRMGVPEKDASYYKHELDAGRTIELVRVAGQELEVLEILRHFGAQTTRLHDSDAPTATDLPDAAPGMYDPIARREDDDDWMTQEYPR